MDSLFQKTDERLDLVRSMITIILGDENGGTWSSINMWYYTRLARHIIETNQDMVDDIEKLATDLRSEYRTFLEYQHNMFSVPYERQGSCIGDDDDCALCLKPLCGPRRTARLRALTDNPRSCGHVFHLECALRIKPDETGTLKCPLCRTEIGPYIRTWSDTESDVPRF